MLRQESWTPSGALLLIYWHAKRRTTMFLIQPRKQPHPYVLFSLIPSNKQTVERIIVHPDNYHRVSFIARVENHLNSGEIVRGLKIGFQISSKSRYTLATIGRTGDIAIECSFISRAQCSLKIHKDTKEILLCDRSSSWSTQTFGSKSLQFESERPDRRVVVAELINNRFRFGGVDHKIFQF